MFLKLLFTQLSVGCESALEFKRIKITRKNEVNALQQI